MAAAKLVLALLWILCLASFLGGDSAAAETGRLVFWLLLVAHAVECAVFLPRLRRAGGGLAGHVVQTLLFGMVHLRSLPKQA